MESVLNVAYDTTEQWWENVPTRTTRVIPALLLRGHGFVKTVKFNHPMYLEDPVNIVKICNENEADEIVILDIMATPEHRAPDFVFLADIAGECFMPLAYGGGVRTIDDIQRLTSLGFEKVCLNTSAIENPDVIREAVEHFGSSTIIVSIDVREKLLGKYEVCIRSGQKRTGLNPVEVAREAEAKGAGELLINSINRDGTMRGYDLKLIRQVANAVCIPVVSCGGASSVQDFRDAVIDSGASAVAAGSTFVFHGPHRAVLINMPLPHELENAGLP